MIIICRGEDMNILAIIFSITAFVCAFIPVYGMIISIILSILAVVFAVITSKDNKFKEGSVIAVTISIFTIIVCIAVNVIYFTNNSKNNKNVNSDRVQLLTTFESTTEKVDSGNLYLTVKNIETFEDKVNVEIELSAIEDTTFSIFDFALSDGTTNNFVVASYNIALEGVEYNLAKNETKTLYLTFGHKLFDGENFIVFTNSEKGVKIRI
jgi:hypothetical protein